MISCRGCIHLDSNSIFCSQGFCSLNFKNLNIYTPRNCNDFSVEQPSTKVENIVKQESMKIDSLTPEQRQWFKDNYGVKTNNEIMKHLNISSLFIFHTMRNELGIVPLKRGVTSKQGVINSKKKQVHTKLKKGIKKLEESMPKEELDNFDKQIINAKEVSMVQEAQDAIVKQFHDTHSENWEVRRQQLALDLLYHLIDDKHIGNIQESDVLNAVRVASLFVKELKNTAL